MRGLYISYAFSSFEELKTKDLNKYLNRIDEKARKEREEKALKEGGFLKLEFYSDPSHGYLKVPKSLLRELGISDKISTYSYETLSFAYLEEDCDATLFIETLKELGIAVEIKEISTEDELELRKYESYSPK